MGNYIGYFRESIKNGDHKKAKDLLLDLHLEAETTKVAVLNELAVMSDEPAWMLLDLLVKLETRYFKSFSADNYNKLIQLITDRAHLNFMFAVILYNSGDGDKMKQAASLMKYILTNCTDRVILFETINAFGTHKIEPLINAVAEFLYYDDSTLKEIAIKNLALMGTPVVYKILLEASKTTKSDQNIVAALDLFRVVNTEVRRSTEKIESEVVSDLREYEWKMDEKFLDSTDNLDSPDNNRTADADNDYDASSPPENGSYHSVPALPDEEDHSTVDYQEKISVDEPVDEPVDEIDSKLSHLKKAGDLYQDLERSEKPDLGLLSSKSIEARFNAFSYFLNNGINYSEELVNCLKSQDHDMVVNSLRIIAAVATEDLLPDIYSFLGRKNIDPYFEHEAFEALSAFEKFSFTEVMSEAIEKPAIHVRMSAVKALNMQYNDPVYAKIKNRIETGREKGEQLVRTIIDAHAGNLINYLMVSDSFVDMASTYLVKEATPYALEHYLNILVNRGLKATAKKIEQKADMERRVENYFKSVVITSSDTVLRIYEKLLFRNGYLVEGFEGPESAFEKISVERPDLIVCDLFTIDMTAIDFAREVREFYSINDLPFLVSTRQKDFILTDFKNNYPDINEIFRFPAILKGLNELIN